MLNREKRGKTLLRSIIGPAKDGTIIGWRKLHNEKCHYAYSSLDIMTVTKSRLTRWTERVTTMKYIGN
jgi:hypothetical protein